jgi:RNA polymerase sigma-70 factor (ECF subfamily)
MTSTSEGFDCVSDRVREFLQVPSRKTAGSFLDGAVWYARCTSTVPWREIMLQQRLEEANAPCTPGELDRIPNPRSFADPDAALVEALKARTSTAFDELVKQYERRLLTVAMRITKNREDAEDVVQECFFKIFKKVDSFRGESRFSSWLTQIATNQALMLIRSNTQNFVSIDEGPEVGNRAQRPEIRAGGYTPEQLCAQREFEVVILNLENVRKSSRGVMELRVKRELSEMEIAQVLNLTLSAVKTRLYRGRLDLREAISRSLDSAKLARTRMNMPSTTAKPEPPPNFIGANGLAGDNPSPVRSSKMSSKLQSCVPYQFACEPLTQPSLSYESRHENCF